MKKSIRTFGLSLFILLAVIAIGIGFLFGIDNPVPWIMIAVLVALPFIHKRMMARSYVAWSEDYRIGIKNIDEDHQKLLGLINNLQTAAHYPTGEAFERQALDQVVDYTKYHFKREEDLMRENGYPDYEPHKREHEQMIAKVDEYLAAYEKDPEATIEELVQYLKRWLIKHIQGTDRKYAPYLLDKGVR